MREEERLDKKLFHIHNFMNINNSWQQGWGWGCNSQPEPLRRGGIIPPLSCNFNSLRSFEFLYKLIPGAVAFIASINLKSPSPEGMKKNEAQKKNWEGGLFYSFIAKWKKRWQTTKMYQAYFFYLFLYIYIYIYISFSLSQWELIE